MIELPRLWAHCAGSEGPGRARWGVHTVDACIRVARIDYGEHQEMWAELFARAPDMYQLLCLLIDDVGLRGGCNEEWWPSVIAARKFLEEVEPKIGGSNVG